MDDLKLQVKKLWAAFARRLSGLGLGISGKYFTVKAVPDGEDAIGYTMSGSKIFISNDNKILDKLEKIEERLTFMRGVFLHELMHQIETDFVTWENVRKTVKDPVEQRIFHTIANVIEDPAIEWHARYYMRKEALKNLEFAMATTYKFGPDIDPKSTPFQQFMTALIQYGDGGLIKGTLCDEANEILCKALPVVDKAIEEDNGAKRIYLSKEVFEIARPLWEPEAANIKAMNALLEKLLREFGKAIASSSGEKINKKELKGEGESDPASEKLEKRRNITFHKVSKEEMEKMKKDSSDSMEGMDGDGDIDVYYCDDDDDADDKDGNSGSSIPAPSSKKSGKKDSKSDDSSSSGENGEKSDGKSGKDGKSGDSDDSEGNASSDKPGDSDSDDGSDSDGKKDGSSKKNDKNDGSYNPEESDYQTPDGSGSGTSSGKDQRLTYDKSGNAPESHVDAAEEDVSSDEDFELSDDEMESVAAEIEAMEEEVEITQREADELDGEELDISIDIPKYSGCNCMNYRDKTEPSDSMVEAYNAVVARNKSQITRLVSQLKRIIRNEAEETSYRSSGKVNIKRLSDARLSSRVFSKRVDPANKGDMAVFILVDNSGSMGHHKIEQARNCAIALSEVFVALNIPIKVMGFSDGNGYDACHYHYVNWSKSLNERVKLLGMESRNSNFDGYAIRYATKALMKRHEQNKMLIVISDGQPACRFYWGTDGISDTSDAVREAKHNMTVVGVAIDADIDVLHTMYGEGFVLANNLDEMFTNIAKKIKREMKV